MATIDDLHWGKSVFLSKCELFLGTIKRTRMIPLDFSERAALYSAQSSTYYSIAGTAAAQLKESLFSWFAPVCVPLWFLTWMPLGAWCYWRMLPLSNRVVALIGYENMTADQCDVRQSILRRRGKYGEAVECISWGLIKDRADRKDLHTRSLLLLGRAQIWARQLNWTLAYAAVQEALQESAGVEEADPQQAIRIYRQSVEILLSHPANYAEKRAQISTLQRRIVDLLKVTGAKDQALKAKRIA